MIAGNGGIVQAGVLIHIGAAAGNGIIEDPCAVRQFCFQIVFSLHEAAQIPSFYIFPNIPQRPDAVEKRISFMSNIGDLIFFVARFRQLLLYAAFSQGLFCASSIRNRSSISENDSVRLNFSDTFPGSACNSSILAQRSG